MLQIAFRNFRRAALTGALALAAGSSASAGWLCGWCGQAERPWYNPCNEPNWGVQETQWRRFPTNGYSGGMQGSYCATGGCPTPGAAIGAPVLNSMSQPIAPGHAVPNPTLQRMIIPSQPGHTLTPVLPPAGHSGTAPVFSAPSQAVPVPMNGGTQPLTTPGQFDSQIFQPHEMLPIPDNNVPAGSGQPRVMAPTPLPAGGLGGAGGVGVGTGNGASGSGGGSGAGSGLVPMPDDMLPPRPQGSPNGAGGNSNGNGGNGGNANPIPPMDGSLPPMPQAGYYQSPFSTAGYGGVQYSTPPPAQVQYGAAPVGQTQYGTQPAGQTQYAAAPAGPGQYGATQYGPPQNGSTQTGQMSYGGVAGGRMPVGGNLPQTMGAQNLTVPGDPAQNYPVPAQQMPTSRQYQQNIVPQNAVTPVVPTPRLPFRGVSYSAPGGESATPSRNPFKMMSRLWSRKK
ncbi:MAG: hypothetical protein NXI04_26170 [Planctomycetaceae bacterium]|nr:hypothetical protein [Planctomycetaceae bacterium]